VNHRSFHLTFQKSCDDTVNVQFVCFRNFGPLAEHFRRVHTRATRSSACSRRILCKHRPDVPDLGGFKFEFEELANVSGDRKMAETVGSVMSVQPSIS